MKFNNVDRILFSSKAMGGDTAQQRRSAFQRFIAAHSPIPSAVKFAKKF
jgi:hypothetical protein